MYSLSHQAGRNALTVEIQGFWSQETFESFQSDVVEYVQRLTQGGRHHVVIVNVSQSAIQTQEIIRSFQTLIRDEQPQPRKLAFVATTALSRMQTRRLVMRPNIRLFDDMLDAERWLDQPAE